jgi:hypothetical protein
MKRKEIRDEVLPAIHNWPLQQAPAERDDAELKLLDQLHHAPAVAMLRVNAAHQPVHVLLRHFSSISLPSSASVVTTSPATIAILVGCAFPLSLLHRIFDCGACRLRHGQPHSVEHVLPAEQRLAPLGLGTRRLGRRHRFSNDGLALGLRLVGGSSNLLGQRDKQQAHMHAHTHGLCIYPLHGAHNAGGAGGAVHSAQSLLTRSNGDAASVGMGLVTAAALVIAVVSTVVIIVSIIVVPRCEGGGKLSSRLGVPSQR